MTSLLSNPKKYNIIILTLSLLFIPACTKREMPNPLNPLKKIFNSSQKSKSNNFIDSGITEEELDSFILQEDYNPFTSPILADYQDAAEINFENIERPLLGDILKDSSQYGFMTIYFDFDRYNIKPDQRKALDKNLSVAKDLSNKGYEIVIEGHACDFAGSPHYNLFLSEDRAKAVADYLEQNGVSKISTVGRGAEMCIVPHGSKEEQAPNRRVEIYAYAPTKTPKSTKATK